MKLCLLCRNLFAMETVMGHADAEGTIICSATKVSDLDIATSAELKEAVRRVHAMKPISDARTQSIREKTLGFSFMGYNILNDPALDSVLEPAEHFMSDWMHCLFVGGVWNICLQMVLRALWNDGIRDASRRSLRVRAALALLEKVGPVKAP